VNRAEEAANVAGSACAEVVVVETRGWEFASIDSGAGSVEEDACGPSKVVERSKKDITFSKSPVTFSVQNTSRQRYEDGCFKERGRAIHERFDVSVSFEFVACRGTG
jgi:hypothetical protein